jgi:16S rRNA (adenine1518-N6/adenine1519-N6)-dimethyltransferase
MNVAALREMLDRHGLRLSRDLGQNFLVDASYAEELARRAGADADTFVIEVGTGLGVLTRALAERCARVRSVEIDSGLVRVLETEQLLPPTVELVHADAREVDFRAWLDEVDGPARVIANLPYSVATPLLRNFLDLRDRLEDWSLMIQKEVAERLVADCGDRAYGSLSVLHRLTTDVEVVASLSPARFFPRPKVDSSFVRVWPHSKFQLAEGELAQVERLARAAFSQRRKRVTNSLRRVAERQWADREPAQARGELEGVLREVGIDPGLRPERIEPEAWLALARRLAAESGDPSPGRADDV